MRYWGIPPESDSGKRSVSVSDIADLWESSLRLPPHWADYIYEQGESGMGYCCFRLHFRDGSSQAYLGGNAIDFVRLPAGRTYSDIVRVERHTRQAPEGHKQNESYYWSIYE